MAWLSGMALVGTCWAGPRSLRDEIKDMPPELRFSVAMFDHGKLSTAPIGSPKDGWGAAEIPDAVGHSWSYEGMLSPDGTLAAFPYWEVNPCPSWKTCDVEANRRFFLAIVPVNGTGARKYPQIVLPSEMCWTRDNSKLAMVAQSDKNPQRQLVVLHLDTGITDRVADGEAVAVTPQCWSPDGRHLVYFAGDKSLAGPGAIRILDTATQVSRDLLHGGPDCRENILCANPYPTWSPDGEWIAYLQNKTYWVIDPSGQEKRRLFRRSSALSPLQWSPDMRYALYADCCAFRDTFRCMCEIGRIRVRRLADNSEIEVSGDGFQDMFIPRWTWIQKTRSK
jgi:hypothetical protein